MGSNYRITFAESAVLDLEAIRSWYDGQQVPEVADRLISKIISKIEKLAEFPQSGRVVPEFDVHYLREIIFPPFRIVYRLGDNTIQVVRIWRGERQLKLAETSG